MTVDVSLRLGVFRDRPVFEQMLDPEAGVVVPAHIAAYSIDGLWGFLRGIGAAQGTEACRFFYDPMTYWFDVPPEFWSKGSGAGEGEDLRLPISDTSKIRPAFLALLRAYGMESAVQTAQSAGALRRAFVDACVPQSLDFQRQGSQPRSQRAVDKYAAILELELEATGLVPTNLVAPYFGLSAFDRDSVAEQAELNAAALAARRPGESMWTVLALESRRAIGSLREPARQRLTLDGFDGVGLWVSDLDEYESPTPTLRAYRALIASIGRPTWIMYGGYFAMLLGREGVVNVSHGVYYTESKRMRGPVGSGPAPERYYVPSLHRFYEPSRAFLLIRRLPDLACTCPECVSLDELVQQAARASTSPAARMEWAQRLQRHFLSARRQEQEALESKSRGELIADMRSTISRLATLGAGQLQAIRIPADHLQRWVSALE